jgi:DNA (cytosine-5)-methyltransferase 1
MKHASLFSGIGGFDLAAQWMGWDNLFHCEIDKTCQKILQYYWPNAKTYTDVKTTDFTIWRGRIDVLTGGFPCQPYSSAGKRKGKEDERHLWPEMLRAIREIQPTWVVGENVLGLTNWNGGLVFEEVCADLEAEGYEVQPYVLPAAGINAPHRRDRVWFVAKNTMYSGRIHRKHEQEGTSFWELGNTRARSSDGICISKGATSNANGFRRNNRSNNWKERQIYYNGKRNTTQGEPKRAKWEYRIRKIRCNEFTPNTTIEGCRWEHKQQPKQREFRRCYSGNGFDNFQNFPTQPPICGGDDGLPRELDGITFPKWRQESIKQYGNAVVPGIPFRIFQAIEEYCDAQE